MSNVIKVYCDGGSRGNPGKSASAFVVEEEGNKIYSEAKYLGIVTNNFAEYSAVISALNWIGKDNKFKDKEIVFILDSELVVKQINGEYKVKNIKLKKLHTEIKNILNSYKGNIIFKNVSREKNVLADLLLNQKLDSLS